MDAARYLAGKDIFPFKDQWVRGYRAAIIAAANRWDIPPALLAGVAYNEVGGDPAWADGAAFELRKVIANGKPADRTSFGDVSIQLRRAAQSLGYGDNPTPAQIAAVRASLQNPVQNLFIVASTCPTFAIPTSAAPPHRSSLPSRSRSLARATTEVPTHRSPRLGNT